MSRIFVSLSGLPILLIFITMGVGLWIGDYNGAAARVAKRNEEFRGTTEELAAHRQENMKELAEPDRRFQIHFHLGLITAVTTLLINCLSVTYLTGTARWIKEVTDTYDLERKYLWESTVLKRRTYPWSIAGACVILVVVALGAASDPATVRNTTAQWVTPHLYAAMFGTCIIVAAIWMQAMNLQSNSAVIERVVEAVRKERIARGLPTE